MKKRLLEFTIPQLQDIITKVENKFNVAHSFIGWISKESYIKLIEEWLKDDSMRLFIEDLIKKEK